MPRRRTKRGGERTPLAGDYDVIVCGASFGGLAVARELAGRGRVLLLDRYEIGERQTSACAAPTAWLEALGLEDSIRQTFDKLVMHTPHSTVRFPLPWTFSTFDYPQLCRLLDDQNDADFETAKVEGRGPGGGESDRGPHRPRHRVRAPGRRRARLAADPRRRAVTSRRMLRSREASRCIRTARATSSRSGSTARSSRPATDGASRPATRCASASDRSTPASTSRTRPSISPGSCSATPSAIRGTGSHTGCGPPWRTDVFFAGDSAGHCLPLTAEGIRTALYFGIALGRELREVVEGRATRETALRRYGAFSDEHEWKFRWMLRAQRAVPRVPPRALALAESRDGHA